MEQQVDRLLEKTWAKLRATPDNARLMIAISGIPGSGKTGLASMMAQRINQLYSPEHPEAPPIATAIPMDGYHLTRAELASMPDPEFAAARRGAAFTFDGEKFLRLVQALRDPLTVQSPSLYAPSFDHAVKDPIENDIAIPASCRAIFFEGNYLSLDKPPWNQAAKLMDELWFVDVDFETARKRLLRRHVQAGIAKNVDEADKRARENDLVNGKEIVDRRMDVQEIITSYYDGRWDA